MIKYKFQDTSAVHSKTCSDVLLGLGYCSGVKTCCDRTEGVACVPSQNGRVAVCLQPQRNSDVCTSTALNFTGLNVVPL